MNLSPWAPAAVALAALGLLSWLEFRRLDRRRLTLRLLASATAIAGLLGLALRPERSRQVEAERAVLATDGASDAFASHLADSLGAARVLRLGDSVPDAGVLRRRFPGVTELVIAGWGLGEADLDRLDGIALSFVPSPLPDGVIEAVWPARITLGEELTVRGKLGTNGIDWLTLATASGVDSIRPAADGSFAFMSRPLAAGLMTFVLQTDTDADTGAAEVQLPRPPRVLILEAMPGFETSRLRDWLTRQGTAVAIRSAISGGRTRVEIVNGATAPSPQPSRTELAEFDIAIVDARSFARLTAAARRGLRDAVERDGLGLLLRPDGRLPEEGFASFTLERMPGIRSRTIRIRNVLSDTGLTSPIVSEPLLFADQFGMATLLEDERGRPVARWRPAGAGRVAVSLVRSPSRWLLVGDSASYGRYWAALLSGIARPMPRWSLDNAAPARVSHPVTITRIAERRDSVVVRAPDATLDTVFLTPNADSTRWSGSYWTRSAGRHLVLGATDTAMFRASEAAGWPTLSAATRSAATLRRVVLSSERAQRGAGATRPVPLPKWWFFLPFITGAGVLWWERRQAGRA